WSLYNAAAERSDEVFIAHLRDSMGSVLIISGLFSATVTSLIVESYRTLERDPASDTVLYLAEISKQLAEIAHGPNFGNSSFQPIPSLPPFEPSASDVTVNMLWILSLMFSLACGLVATMVLSWLNKYSRMVDLHADPRHRATQHARYFNALKQSNLNLLVEALPALLHASFVLFFLGIVTFMIPINTLIATVVTIVAGILGVLYLACTAVPFFIEHSPYSTPLS
ncbi:hypothetical protein BXZ70DRAFT_867575, partial [Cristinia sonorae]